MSEPEPKTGSGLKKAAIKIGSAVAGAITNEFVSQVVPVSPTLYDTGMSILGFGMMFVKKVPGAIRMFFFGGAVKSLADLTRLAIDMVKGKAGGLRREENETTRKPSTDAPIEGGL